MSRLNGKENRPMEIQGQTTIQARVRAKRLADELAKELAAREAKRQAKKVAKKQAKKQAKAFVEGPHPSVIASRKKAAQRREFQARLSEQEKEALARALDGKIIGRRTLRKMARAAAMMVMPENEMPTIQPRLKTIAPHMAVTHTPQPKASLGNGLSIKVSSPSELARIQRLLREAKPRRAAQKAPAPGF